MPDLSPSFLSLGDIARDVGVERHRVVYVADRRLQMRPASRIAGIKAYSPDQVDAIKVELANVKPNPRKRSEAGQ